MAQTTDVGPVVRFPERVDRKTRLGPFPSARDALRFLCYAATGALVSPWVSPFLWLPIVGGGFVVSVWQPEGRPVDERAWTYLRWRARALVRRDRVSSRRASIPRQATLRLTTGEHVAMIRSGGCPMAYLPPEELERRFAQYRELLRTMAGEFSILATTVPIHARPFRPTLETGHEPEDEARRGYLELATLLCRRRRVRRIYLALRASEPGPETLAQLEREVGSLMAHLRGLGLRPVRLTGAPLADAAHGFGWS